MGLTNKKLGNSFEAEFCEILSNKGFWAHNLTQNSAGQPADVIAAINGEVYLIDCKVCSGDKFDKRRIEENQRSAMELWETCGNGEGLFAIKIHDQIFMVRLSVLLASPPSSLTVTEMTDNGLTLEDWFWSMGL